MTALHQAQCFNRVLHFNQAIGRMISGTGALTHCVDFPRMLEETMTCIKSAVCAQRCRIFEVDYNSIGQTSSLYLVAGETGLIGQRVGAGEFAGVACGLPSAHYVNHVDLHRDKRYGQSYRYMDTTAKFALKNLVAAPVRSRGDQGRPVFVVEAYNKVNDADFDELDSYIADCISEGVAAAMAWITNSQYSAAASDFTEQVLQTTSLYDFDRRACSQLATMFACEEACILYCDLEKKTMWRYTDRRNVLTGSQDRDTFNIATRSLASEQLQKRDLAGKRDLTTTVVADPAKAPAFNADVDQKPTRRCRNAMVVTVCRIDPATGEPDSEQPLAVIQLRNRIANVNIHKLIRSDGTFRSRDVEFLDNLSKQVRCREELRRGEPPPPLLPLMVRWAGCAALPAVAPGGEFPRAGHGHGAGAGDR